MRRVLYISYAYPPTGGGGVQRSVKFTKYLGRFGWQPTVLTAANPSVPVQDNALARDIDPSIEIVHARTWEPGYRWKQCLGNHPGASNANVAVSPRAASKWGKSLKDWTRTKAMAWLQPDPQVLWNRSAYRKAIDALAKRPHDAIFVTGPPFSSFLLACRLKRQSGLPLVVDFRDEWMLACRYLDNHQQLGAGAKRQYQMMLEVLASADTVIATTQASAAELTKHCFNARSNAVVSCIYNGFDPEDFSISQTSTEVKSKRFRLVYTGTLWRLTDIRPLVDAIIRLHERSPRLCSRMELVLAGRRTADQDLVLGRLDRTGVSLIKHEYLPHDETIRLAAGADALLLLLSGDVGAERVVPAKLFEYLAANRPVLAICPQGETRDLLFRYGSIQGQDHRNVSGITDWLAERIAGVEHLHADHHSACIAPFSRVVLTQQLSRLLDDCVPVKRKAA